MCEEERQFTPPGGQSWTTLERLAVDHLNGFHQHEPGLIGIRTLPVFAIGQRALLLRTPHGNVLWDCISLIDDATVTLIKGLGGVQRHRHLAPALLHHAGRSGAARSAIAGAPARRRPRMGHAARSLHSAVGGRDAAAAARRDAHARRRPFPGRRMLHWAKGADGRGVLCSSTSRTVTPTANPSRFMRSYPNLIPLPRGVATDRRGAGAVRVRQDLQPSLRPGDPVGGEAGPAGLRRALRGGDRRRLRSDVIEFVLRFAVTAPPSSWSGLAAPSSPHTRRRSGGLDRARPRMTVVVFTRTAATQRR